MLWNWWIFELNSELGLNIHKHQQNTWPVYSFILLPCFWDSDKVKVLFCCCVNVENIQTGTELAENFKKTLKERVKTLYYIRIFHIPLIIIICFSVITGQTDRCDRTIRVRAFLEFLVRNPKKINLTRLRLSRSTMMNLSSQWKPILALRIDLFAFLFLVISDSVICIQNKYFSSFLSSIRTYKILTHIL